jgi:ABC-type Fe3+-siderophore transport system permease subunit
MESQIIISLSFFAMIFGIVFLFIRTKERQALIEKGVNASIFDSKKSEISSLKWGLLLVGIGVGILFGKLLAVITALNEEPAFFSMICLFGGIGLIIFHQIARRLEK